MIQGHLVLVLFSGNRKTFPLDRDGRLADQGTERIFLARMKIMSIDIAQHG